MGYQENTFLAGNSQAVSFFFGALQESLDLQTGKTSPLQWISKQIFSGRTELALCYTSNLFFWINAIKGIPRVSKMRDLVCVCSSWDEQHWLPTPTM